VARSLAIDHLGLTVASIERSLTFWRDLLGLEVTGRGTIEWEHIDRLTGIPRTRIEWIELRLPDGATIELQQYHRPVGQAVPHGEENEPGRSHVSIVVDDAAAVLERARAAGFRSRSSQVVLIERGAYRGSLAAYILDPDGYGVELMQHASERTEA
jgi:lactoylglutathione lyase